jgi:uncharacterized membrane protein
MPLTYQPFSEVPEIEKLRGESGRGDSRPYPLERNVSATERIIGGFLGAAFATAGLSRGRRDGWALALLGGALLWRSVTGRCPLYAQHPRNKKAGVSGNRGKRVEASVEIRCAARPLFQFWRNLEQLPKVMSSIESVAPLDGRRSHWRVAGLLGRNLEWDAEIINEHEDNLIAWRSLPGAMVDNAGSVRFESMGDVSTRVKVALEFDPPGGALGAALAAWVGRDLQSDLAADLERFKEYAERELNHRVE